eukprot:9758717-Alexandrium_andersonii.AAC.1
MLPITNATRMKVAPGSFCESSCAIHLRPKFARSLLRLLARLSRRCDEALLPRLVALGLWLFRASGTGSA